MTLDDKIIQFRASGVRVKLPTFSPALNLVGTQIPIFPWVHVPDSELLGRYMTIKEAARIHWFGMPNILTAIGWRLTQNTALMSALRKLSLFQPHILPIHHILRLWPPKN